MSPTVDLCLYVNGERVPEALVLDELKRLRSMPYFQQIPDQPAREAQLIFAAESGAVDRVLLKQEAAKDKTPISVEEMERGYAVLNSSGGCRPGMDPNTLIPRLENQARFSRAVRTLVGTPPKLECGSAKAYYDAHAEEFRTAETFDVSHIVTNVAEGGNEEKAREAIDAAHACVRSGEDFAAVARRLSDCPHDGGRLPASVCPRKPSGSMRRAAVWNRSAIPGAMNCWLTGNIDATSGRENFRSTIWGRMDFAAPRQLMRFCRTASDYSTARATCGSGARITLTRIGGTRARR